MSESNSKRPEWTPEGADPTRFTSEVKEGIGEVRTHKHSRVKRKVITSDQAIAGILEGNRTVLSQAITMVESRLTEHRAKAAEILRGCIAHSGKSVRIGITGVPGAGKSSFIETFGTYLCKQGHKVAVLAVDPSSARSGGSILGDKTRMEELSREPNAFIRPSPSGGELGGVAAKTREAMLLCEAAGFNVILIETVGVGQSEVAVRSMVDFFLLLQIAGAGDELQGIKKGVIEMADAIAVNKADGDNVRKAHIARVEYERVLHFLTPYTRGWKPRAMACSAHTGDGLDRVWRVVEEFCVKLKKDDDFGVIRKEQNREWFHTLLREAVLERFYKQPDVQSRLPVLDKRVAEDQLPVLDAVRELLAGDL